MSELRSIGLKSLKVGAVAADGGPGTVLESWGTTYKGTASFVTEDGQSTEHECEEEDDPIEVEETPGKTVLKWTTTDLEPAALKKQFGGEISGSEWKAPAASETIEGTIEFVTKRDVKVVITRAKIVSKFNWELGKEGISKIDHVATVLTPKKAATSKFTIGKATASQPGV